jgi:bifunctional enzyme CysN/CysC
MRASEHTRPPLRVMTCGSVDDGKSTLIGRLLHDAGRIPEDELLALAEASRSGTVAGGIDYSLLLDGLEAEREQGITIDVAYRYFGTARRMFIVADTPGHVQYTRNTATAASGADLAVVLVDVRKGLLEQTRRHTIIAHLFGVRHFVLAANKMDLVDYDPARFRAIEAAYKEFVSGLGAASVVVIPISALAGDNVVTASERMPWYDGPALLPFLERVEAAGAGAGAMRLPVQLVTRAGADFRGYAGTLSGARLARGDQVVAMPSGRQTRIDRIVAFEGDRERADPGEAITVLLADTIDLARGDVLAPPGALPEVSDQFVATLVWLAEKPLLAGRSFVAKIACRTTTATITGIRHKIDVATLAKSAARTLALNEIGSIVVDFAAPVVFDAYEQSRVMGGFILVDRLTNETVAAGLVQHGLRRAQNVKWQSLDVNPELRGRIKGHKGCCVWLTGLSGAGKSTIANALEKHLCAEARHTFILDGDNLRHGINRDLGFTDADRVENVRRAAEVARLMVEAGLVVIVALIAPFADDRRMARELFAAGSFIEVFVDTPLAVCEARDPKSLYRKARAGFIPNMTGINAPYERPEAPDLKLDTSAGTAEALAQRIAELLDQRIALDE